MKFITFRCKETLSVRRVSHVVVLFLSALLLLTFTGCHTNNVANQPETEAPAQTVSPTEDAVPQATTPPNGNPEDVTCKGSYTARNDKISYASAAAIAGRTLTMKQLQVYYWMEVNTWLQGNHESMPDISQSLDTQLCPEADNTLTWQQFFLQRALDSWHGQQALVLMGEDEGVPLEAAYQPNLANHEKYMTDMPATEVLYGYGEEFLPNALHQEFLDQIPELLHQLASAQGFSSIDQLAEAIAGTGTSAEALAEYAELYNRGYMYYVTLTYYTEPAQEEIPAYFTSHRTEYESAGITPGSGRYVNMRHLLMIPQGAEVAADGTVTCSQEAWDACMKEAQWTLTNWSYTFRPNEWSFAAMANRQSADPGSRLHGGLYRNVHQGQLIPELDQWCFDESRVSGDTAVIRSDYGCHIVYFCSSRESHLADAEADLTASMYRELVQTAKEKYPMSVYYRTLLLGDAQPGSTTVTPDDLLYPDIAHERFSQVQLYLQQDYPTTLYGNYNITSHGCGITTMAMLATYLSDTELTPPALCAIYDRYCFPSGTDGRLFSEAPPEMGFYLRDQVFDFNVARDAMEEGCVVVVVQHKGYWTRGGHYLLLERLTEDGLVQVRDSNIFNYGRLVKHKEDAFPWSTITAAGMSFWIYEPKIIRTPSCCRCGTDTESGNATAMLKEDYYCEKCEEAILRRNSYMQGLYS